MILFFGCAKKNESLDLGKIPNTGMPKKDMLIYFTDSNCTLSISSLSLNHPDTIRNANEKFVLHVGDAVMALGFPKENQIGTAKLFQVLSNGKDSLLISQSAYGSPSSIPILIKYSN